MKRYHYFVEGECEKKLLKSFMYVDSDSFIEGKVEVFNFVNERISLAKVRTIKKNTTVVIVTDTDVKNIDVLDSNIKTINRIALSSNIDIIILFSIEKFEDEIVYSCDNINNINELFKTQSISDFKKKFIKHENIYSRLNDAGFDIKKIWTRNATYPFDAYSSYKAGIIKKKH